MVYIKDVKQKLDQCEYNDQGLRSLFQLFTVTPYALIQAEKGEAFTYLEFYNHKLWNNPLVFSQITDVLKRGYKANDKDVLDLYRQIYVSFGDAYKMNQFVITMTKDKDYSGQVTDGSENETREIVPYNREDLPFYPDPAPYELERITYRVDLSNAVTLLNTTDP